MALIASGTWADDDLLIWELYDDGLLYIEGAGLPLPDYADYGDTPWYPYRDSVITLDVGTCSRIGDNCFCYCSNLTTVFISGDLNSIGTRAFEGCRNLRYFNDGVIECDSIGDWAFSACENLCNMEDTPELAGHLFLRCPTIGTGAFIGCTSIVRLEIDDYSRIGDRAFDECYGVKAIWFGTVMRTIGTNSFRLGMRSNPVTVYFSGRNYTSSPLTQDAIGEYTTVTFVEVYATLRYDTQGSVDTISSDGMQFNDVWGPTANITVTSSKPSKSSSTFSHWNTRSDGSGASYLGGATVAVDMGSTVTLYAIYTYDGQNTKNVDAGYSTTGLLVSLKGTDLLLEGDGPFEDESNPVIPLAYEGETYSGTHRLPEDTGYATFLGYRKEVYVLRRPEGWQEGDALVAESVNAPWLDMALMSNEEVYTGDFLLRMSGSQLPNEYYDSVLFAIRLIGSVRVEEQNNLYDDMNVFITFRVGESEGAVGAPKVILSKTNRSGDTVSITIPGVTKFESLDSVTLLRSPIMCYPVRCKYIIDSGTNRTYTVSFTRPQPEVWNDDSEDQEEWSNAKWSRYFYDFFDYWQNVAYNDTYNGERVLTGGFLFNYIPVDRTLHQTIENKNVFLKGSIEATLERGRFSASMSMAVSNMQTNRAGDASRVTIIYYDENGDIYLTAQAYRGVPVTFAQLPPGADTLTSVWIDVNNQTGRRFSANTTVEFDELTWKEDGTAELRLGIQTQLTTIVFNDPGTYTYRLGDLVSGTVQSARVYVVGAGGGGGNSVQNGGWFEEYRDIFGGGGGGAGYVNQGTFYAQDDYTVSFTVGAGGEMSRSGGASSFRVSESGGNTTFSLIANGGSGGGDATHSSSGTGGAGSYYGGDGGFRGRWTQRAGKDGSAPNGDAAGKGVWGTINDQWGTSVIVAGGAANDFNTTVGGTVYRSLGAGFDKKPEMWYNSIMINTNSAKLRSASCGGGGAACFFKAMEYASNINYTADVYKGGNGIIILTLYGV